MARKEVQAHGFNWERELIFQVYGATEDELKKVKYTNKMDLPASLNRLNQVDLSIKTSCSANAVCMADCLRIYDAVASGTPFHMTVVHYIQDDATNHKRLASITEVNLTAATEELFGTLTRDELAELDALIKSVPQKRKPTEMEHTKIYALRDKLQAKSGAIHMDPKCNSQQSRLQCSFNAFQKFLKDHPERVIATSTTNAFRGGSISSELVSGRRVFKRQRLHQESD